MVGDIVLALIIFFWVIPTALAILLWLFVHALKAFFSFLEFIGWLFYDAPREAGRAIRRAVAKVR